MQNMNMGQQNFMNRKMHKPNYDCSVYISRVSNKQNFDDNEINSITNTVTCLYNPGNQQQPLSHLIVYKLKKKYGGEWIVLVSNKDKKVGCSASSIPSKDFLTFYIGNSKFQIYRLK